MSAIISTQAYLCYFNQGATTPTCAGPQASVQGGITAAMSGGSWLGALISGYVSDNIGRKKSIMIGALIWCVGCIIVAASQNIGMFLKPSCPECTQHYDTGFHEFWETGGNLRGITS
jgi:MFS family permease